MKKTPLDLAIRLASSVALLALALVAVAAFSLTPTVHAAPSYATSATAGEQIGAKNCTITKRLPQGTSLVIANATTRQIVYRVANNYPTLTVNGVSYNGRYHRFAIGRDISLVRPYFSTDFYVTVACPKWGISDPE